MIGDSHIGFYSQRRDLAMNLTEHFKAKDSVKSTILEKNVHFFWEHGKTAYSVTKEYMLDFIKDDLDNISTIVFSYGCLDVYLHINKYNNEKYVVKKYVDECLALCKSLNCTPVFVYPIAHIIWDKIATRFNNALKDECASRGLDEPIQILGNIVNKDFLTEDTYIHLGVEDSRRAIEYIVSKVIKEDKTT